VVEIRRLSVGTRVMLLVGFVMIMLIFGLFSWIYVINERHMESLLKEQAKGIADQVILVRLWNAQNKERIEPVLSVLSNKKFPYKWKMVSKKPIGTENLPENEFQSRAIDSFRENPQDVYRIYEVDGRRYFEYAGPIIMEEPCLRCHIDQGYRRGDVHGAIVVTIPMDEAMANLQETKLSLLYTALILLLSVMVLLYFILKGTVIMPINILKDALSRVGKGDYNVAIEIKRSDEIGDLAQSFNQMVRDLRSKERQIIRSEKLATVGKLAAGVAHEINNPLGNISLYAQMLSQKIKSDEARKKLKIIEEQATQAARIVKSLLEFSRQMEPKFRKVNLNDVVNKTLEILQPQISINNIKVIKNLDSALPEVKVDPAQIQQVLVNMIKNAIEAMNEGGTLTIETRRRNGEVEIGIIDTGEGIPEENLSRIFDPFFSTKGVGKGTGLGLSVSYGIVERHGGRIEVESEVGVGSTFRIILPLGDGDGKDIDSGG
jgi:two-component system NtrC family sensor kinase